MLQVLIPNLTSYLLLNELSFSEPWRFVTALFIHADTGHLLYNMFALGLFGFMLESVVGSRKFLSIFLITGIIANVAGWFVYPSSLGASGAIFGVIGTLVFLRPSLIVFAFGLPMPLFIAGILWVAGDFIGLFNPNSNIGYVAHLTGIAVGAIIGMLMRKNYKEHKEIKHKIRLPEKEMRRWEDSHLR